MENDLVLREIQRKAEPLWSPSLSSDEWLKTWNRVCEDVANAFRDQSLESSAEAALSHKVTT